MIISNSAVDAYLASLPEERREAMCRLREVIVENLPEGFEEVCNLTPAYVVPLSRFPDGYHCTPDTPLPFMGIASQKGYIALHHFGMYVDQALMSWFVAEYPKHISSRLDMGKSCVRFRKLDQLPYPLIGQLAAKRSVDEWITCYRQALR